MLDSTLVGFFLTVGLISFFWFLIRRTRRMFIVSFSLLTLSLLVWGGVIWFLRDGLGPDSVESQGLLAWTRFLGFFWIPFVFWVGLTLFGLAIVKRKEKRAIKGSGGN